MTRARLHQKPGKGFGSDVKAEGVQAFRGKQPLLNEPLKGCPLYLGFLIFIVNPPQAPCCGQERHYSPAKITGLEKASACTTTGKLNLKRIFRSELRV